MPENRKNKKSTTKRVFHNQFSKRKERKEREDFESQNLEISSLNQMKSNSKIQNLRYIKFSRYATKVAVKCLLMQISYEIYYT